MNKTMTATLSAGAVLGLAGAAQALFTGQTILGPLGPGSSVNGDTALGTNDNNGTTTGTPGTTTWSGNDDVYALNWPGGSITIDLLFTHSSATDVDLFLYAGNGATLLASSTSVSDNESIAGTLAAGSYHIMIDGWQGAATAYTLNVIPTPAAAGVLGMAGLAGLARRRRA